MHEQAIMLLFVLAIILKVNYILHFLFERYKLPSLLASLLMGFLFQIFPLPKFFTDTVFGESYYILSQIGVMFLIFNVGVKLDLKNMKELSGHIVLISILNMAFSTFFGVMILIYFGYSLIISIIVSTALATVSEIVVGPILYELGIIRTRVANLILGSGILDDVAEIIIASIAPSIVIAVTNTYDPFFQITGILVFILLSYSFHKFLLPLWLRLDPEPNNIKILLLIVSTSFLFIAVSETFDLGILLGAIVSGFVFQSFLKSANSESMADSIIRSVSQGFLGPIFFFQIGLSVDLMSVFVNFQLTALLLLANSAGKFIGVLISGKIMNLNIKEIIIATLGLSAKFSMGIIPVQILYASGVCDLQLFSAFVAVSAITTMILPFLVSILVKKWVDDISYTYIEH